MNNSLSLRNDFRRSLEVWRVLFVNLDFALARHAAELWRSRWAPGSTCTGASQERWRSMVASQNRNGPKLARVGQRRKRPRRERARIRSVPCCFPDWANDEIEARKDGSRNSDLFVLIVSVEQDGQQLETDVSFFFSVRSNFPIPFREKIEELGKLLRKKTEAKIIRNPNRSLIASEM